MSVERYVIFVLLVIYEKLERIPSNLEIVLLWNHPPFIISFHS